MNIEFKKSWLPNIIAVVIFAIVATVYFYPSLEGYTLRQGDITSNRGMSKEIHNFIKEYDEDTYWSNSMFGGMPTYQTYVKYDSGYSFIKETIYSVFSGAKYLMFLAFLSFFILLRTLRTNYIPAILGGLAYGLSTYNILIIEAGHNSKMHSLATIPIVLAFLIQFLRSKTKIYLYASLFALSIGYNLYANHIQMTYYFSFVFASLIIAEGIKANKNKYLPEFFKKMGILSIFCVLAIGSNFANIYNTKSFANKTTRGQAIISINSNGQENKDNITKSGLKKDYITQWSYGIGETYNLLVPNAKGDSRHLTVDFFDYLRENHRDSYNEILKKYQESKGQLFKGYWGNQPFTSGPNYIGAILIFLALLYILTVHNPLKWALLSASLLALMLSWGKNFMWLTDIFIDYLPLYNKFRTVSSFLVVLNLILPLMAFLFLNKITQDADFRVKNTKKITQIGLSLVGLIVIIGIIPNGFDFISNNEQAILTRANKPQLDAFYEILISFRKSVFLEDSLFTALQIGIALSVLILFMKSKLNSKYTQIIMVSLAVVNLWMLDKQYLNNEKSDGKYNAWEKLIPGHSSIRMSQGDLDIYKLETKNKNHILEEVADKIKNFRKNEGRRITNQDKENIIFSTLGFNSNYRVINLNDPFNNSFVSYFHKSSGGYSPAKLKRYQDMIDFYIRQELSLVSVNPEKMKALNMLNTKYYLKNGSLEHTNPYALGNAWFVKSIKSVTNNNDEILEFKNIDPKSTAIIHSEFDHLISSKSYNNSSNNTIGLKEYRPNHLTYEANCQTKGLVVFSEVYYNDGWNAYIDGKPVDHLRANYILRALEIPKGNHTIEFKFEPSLAIMSNIINVVCFLILLGLAIFFAFKAKKNTVAGA